MQLPAHNLLSSIIKHYLVIDKNNSTQQHYRLFSDGNPGIVFHFKDPLLQYRPNSTETMPQPMCFVYGQITHFNNLTSFGDFKMLVVVLQPYTLFKLFNIAACELNDSIVQIDELPGNQFKNLSEQVFNASNVHEAIGIFEVFLSKRLDKMNALDGVMQAAISLIYQHKGIISMENILTRLPITERQLERKFNHHIGISPKKCTDIVKLQNFIKVLQRNPAGNAVTSLIYQCGYYDQAHLNNYFKNKTGLTPAQYRANKNLLAVNLMAVH